MYVMREGRFGVVQPYGRDPVRESTVVSMHPTAAAAFDEIDRLSARMVRTGAPSDAVEFLVVDFDKQRVVPRPNTQ
jgi:hypothetical protein